MSVIMSSNVCLKSKLGGITVISKGILLVQDTHSEHFLIFSPLRLIDGVLVFFCQRLNSLTFAFTFGGLALNGEIFTGVDHCHRILSVIYRSFVQYTVYQTLP
jgi:hypothetical protein